jgi:hypothetical protein
MLEWKYSGALKMVKDNGFIFLHRKFKEWEWYKNINVKTLFIHCLIMANFKDNKWQGIEIKRGSFITSIRNLSIETGLTDRQVRTALDKLVLTSELTNKSTNKYRTITVLKYNEYQTVDKQEVKQVTIKRQTIDKPLTTTNKDNNLKNEKNDSDKKDKKNVVYFDNTELDLLFKDFLKLRKKLKAVNSERAIKSLLKTLSIYSDDIKIEMINKSIVSSWKDVFPLKDNYGKEVKIDKPLTDRYKNAPGIR